MPKYIATMVEGPAKDYPTQTITVFEPRPDGAKPRSRRKAHPFTQGQSREVSADLAAILREKRQPVTRGPRMFEIEVIDDKPKPVPPRPRATRAAKAAPVEAPAPAPAPAPAKPKSSGRSRRRSTKKASPTS